MNVHNYQKGLTSTSKSDTKVPHQPLQQLPYTAYLNHIIQ